MGTARVYIGSPSGVVLCVDRRIKGNIEGTLFHGYEREGIPFFGFEDVLRKSEALFDALGFPHRGTKERSFERAAQRKAGGSATAERMAKVMSDEELLRRHGDLGTFVIRVQHRQHSTWQGLVTCMETREEIPFRSALELMKLIDGVLDQTEQKTEPE